MFTRERVSMVIVLASLVIGNADAQVIKVPASELATRSYTSNGLTIEPITITLNRPGQERGFDLHEVRFIARHRSEIAIHGIGVYLFAYSETNRPLFSTSMSTGRRFTNSPLKLGSACSETSFLLLPTRELEKVAYYGVRIVLDSVPAKAAAQPENAAVIQTHQATKCTNPRCLDGSVSFTGFGNTKRKRKCPVCDGTGWMK